MKRICLLKYGMSRKASLAAEKSQIKFQRSTMMLVLARYLGVKMKQRLFSLQRKLK